jgi:uncharacterized protein (UPF0332 family)
MKGLAVDLLATARRLARANPKKPRQADLRRAVSTAYYALFHALAQTFADLFVGTGAAGSDGAWTQTYRALEHGFAKNACAQAVGLSFPVDIVNVADQFVLLQEERHSADYDPDVRYTRAQTLQLIQDAESAILALRGAPKKDQKAFAVLLMMRRR